MYLLGYDCGTSSIKATLIDSQTSEIVCSATAPDKEMDILSQNPGWAEQNPEIWWDNLKKATAKLVLESKVIASDISVIGISYQMHGLVVLDKNKHVLRPSIIWCDSRAVPMGQQAVQQIGSQKCLENLLNLPGNFTAAKLKWVKDNEPDIYSKIDKIMLPGDYIVMKMTNEITTTQSGLSEMILWDFKNDLLADLVMDCFGFSQDLIPNIVPTFGVQGTLTKECAGELGLKVGIPIAYRAGDQPNNALSLNVLNPGEIAATAGTSGVIYGIGDKALYDPESRVNTFLHVNNTAQSHRYGVLLCVSGTGILNSWLKHHVAGGVDYAQMNELAADVPVGSDGLSILPFGNGAERTLENKNIGGCIDGLNFNIHNKGHLFRAAQEGIVFALNYGLQIMGDMDIKVQKVRAGHANMFLSPIFQKTFACTTGSVVELYNTDGSAGAARGAGVGADIYKNFEEAFAGLKCVNVIEPVEKEKPQYRQAYDRWLTVLKKQLIE